MIALSSIVSASSATPSVDAALEPVGQVLATYGADDFGKPVDGVVRDG